MSHWGKNGFSNIGASNIIKQHSQVLYQIFSLGLVSSYAHITLSWRGKNFLAMLQSHFFRFDFHFRYTSKRWYRAIEKITTFVAFQSKHLKNPSFYSTSKFAHERLQKGFKTFLIGLKQFSASHVKISTTMCAKNPAACGAPKCVAKSFLSHLWNNIEFLFRISTSNYMLRFCLIYETKWTFTFPISFGNLCRNLALESYLTSGVRRRMGISSHFHSQALDYETQPSFIFVSLMKQNETSVKVEMMRKTYNST